MQISNTVRSSRGNSTPPPCLNQPRALTITGGSWFFQIFFSVRNMMITPFYSVTEPSGPGLLSVSRNVPYSSCSASLTVISLSMPTNPPPSHSSASLYNFPTFTSISLLLSSSSCTYLLLHLFCLQYCHFIYTVYIYCSCSVSTTVSPLTVCLLLSLHLQCCNVSTTVSPLAVFLLLSLHLCVCYCLSLVLCLLLSVHLQCVYYCFSTCSVSTTVCPLAVCLLLSLHLQCVCYCLSTCSVSTNVSPLAMCLLLSLHL